MNKRMSEPAGLNRQCLAYVSDQTQASLALFAAHRAATLCPDRSFDILICSFEPLEIPDDIAARGIRNLVMPLREKLTSLKMRQKWLPMEVYLRLWLPEMLADRYNRILYADTDTYLVSPNLDALFDVDMGPYQIAGVRDVQQWMDLTAPVNDFAALDLPGDRFLNSGVMMIDTHAFNKSALLEELLAINASDTPTIHHDQSLLNLALRGKWAELNPVWNWQWTHDYPNFTQQADAQMLHFCGPKKPWRAHQKPNRFPPKLIAEYRRFLSHHKSELAFRTILPGGRRMWPWENLRNTRWQNAHPEVLERLIGRFSSPFDTLL